MDFRNIQTLFIKSDEKRYCVVRLHFVILYSRHCSCYVLICLHNAFRNDKELKTLTSSANDAARRTLHVDCLICAVNDVLPYKNEVSSPG